MGQCSCRCKNKDEVSFQEEKLNNSKKPKHSYKYSDASFLSTSLKKDKLSKSQSTANQTSFTTEEKPFDNKNSFSKGFSKEEKEIYYSVFISNKIKIIQRSYRLFRNALLNRHKANKAILKNSNSMLNKSIKKTNADFTTNESRVPLKQNNIEEFKHNYLQANNRKYTSLKKYNSFNTINGFAVQTWKEGAKYIGNHINGKANGFGIFFHSDGDIYKGEFSNDKANGFAFYKYLNGATYEGEWKSDLQYGIGIENWKDGSIYEGDFIEGKKHGVGRYYWSDGSIYEGEWKMNNIQGYGIYKFIDGRIYKGYWENNQMSGFGILKYNDDKLYCGDFINDTKDGFGLYIWKNNGISKLYLGFWKKGNQNGIGKVFSKSSVKYGQWSNGERLTWFEENQALSRLDDNSLRYKKYFVLSYDEIKLLINKFFD